MGRKESKGDGVRIVRSEIQWIEDTLERMEKANKKSKDQDLYSLHEHIHGIRKELKRMADSFRNRNLRDAGKIEQKIIIKGKAFPM